MREGQIRLDGLRHPVHAASVCPLRYRFTVHGKIDNATSSLIPLPLSVADICIEGLIDSLKCSHRVTLRIRSIQAMIILFDV